MPFSCRLKLHSVGSGIGKTLTTSLAKRNGSEAENSTEYSSG